MLLLCPGLTLNHSPQRHLATDVWEVRQDQVLNWTERWLPSWGAAMLRVYRAVTLLSVGWISTLRAVIWRDSVFFGVIFSSFLFPTDACWCRRILNKEIAFISTSMSKQHPQNRIFTILNFYLAKWTSQQYIEDNLNFCAVSLLAAS